MSRRKFLHGTAISMAAVATSGAVKAQSAGADTVTWRMPSSFPKSLDTVWGNAVMIAERVRKLTDNKFDIKTFAAGEIVAPLQVLDAVQSGATECGHTAGFYYLGKEPSLVFDTGVPFGLTPRQHNAWLLYGGGLELLREVYAKFGVVQFASGNTGAQMGGWFRKEIKGVDDLKGLRIRTPGFLGMVYSKLGATPTQIAGGDIYPALEKGTIDAVEWVGPYDDEKLGFAKIAKFYYGPGVMELNASLCFIVNAAAYAKLPQHFKEALQSACAEASVDMLAKYDANNVLALRKLIASGVKLSTWPDAVMKAMQKATGEVIAEQSAKDATFAKVYKQWDVFRKDQQLWSAINDGAAEKFIAANLPKT